MINSSHRIEVRCRDDNFRAEMQSAEVAEDAAEAMIQRRRLEDAVSLKA